MGLACPPALPLAGPISQGRLESMAVEAHHCKWRTGRHRSAERPEATFVPIICVKRSSFSPMCGPRATVKGVRDDPFRKASPQTQPSAVAKPGERPATALQAGEPDAIRRIGESHPRFSDSSQAEIAAAEIVLADAQFVIARELGFDSWPRLKKHFDSLSRSATNMHRLVIEGNVQAMQEAVAQDPESVNEPNESGLSPLYTAALCRNRQAINFLLEHGAIVDIFACAILGKATDAEILLKRNPGLGAGNHAGRHDRFALCGAIGAPRCRRDSPALSFRRECTG